MSDTAFRAYQSSGAAILSAGLPTRPPPEHLLGYRLRRRIYQSLCKYLMISDIVLRLLRTRRLLHRTIAFLAPLMVSSASVVVHSASQADGLIWLLATVCMRIAPQRTARIQTEMPRANRQPRALDIFSRKP